MPTSAPRRTSNNRIAACAALVVVACAPVACQCGPAAAPTPRVGEGKPIGNPDRGDPDKFDAGPPVCVEDGDEPNDARDAATKVSGSDVVHATACGGNDDWYEVQAGPGCDVDARLVEDPASAAGTDAGVFVSGDASMLMFDPSGTLVGSSSSGGDSEAIHIPIPSGSASAAGPYAVRIRAGARDSVPYVLTLTATCAADLVCPADDTSEPNDSPAQLASLSTGVQTQGILCGQNEDWFAVPVSEGCIADARVDFDSSVGDIDFEMYAPDGSTRVGLSQGVVDTEEIKKVVTAGGMMLRVHFFTPTDASANSYRVIASEICAGAFSCPGDDPFEPNDDRASATELVMPLDETIGTICGDDDFFRVALPGTCTMHALLTFTTAEGDLDLELQDTNGNQLAISQGTGDTESLDRAPNGSETVFLRVLGFQGSTNGYRLHVTCD